MTGPRLFGPIVDHARDMANLHAAWLADAARHEAAGDPVAAAAYRCAACDLAVALHTHGFGHLLTGRA